ncbi:cardiolipin synthase ClsB [Methylotenera sp. N17]|uniref:cardiolipin synthase ClsB n=1 Tax=Methylotenera sp. N17 TaxID=1502761 RepID=UPI000647BB7D|nr:cardiolipin synthase ClsB [Methylotenera sp. N17]
MHFTHGNKIKLLRNGLEYFAALEDAIQNAKHDIYVQTYIYQADATGIRIGNALKDAATRGVIVNLLLDGYGCKDLPVTFRHELQQYGIHVKLYRPNISPWTLQKSRLRRMHRKVVTIDGVMGFVGGINIIDDMDVPHHIAPRIDYALQLEGPILDSIVTSVQRLWRRATLSLMQHIDLNFNNPSLSAKQPINQHGIKAAFVVRDNLLHRRDIENAYKSAMLQATSEITIANAYFVPGRNFRQALLSAALRGVKIKLLLQGRQDDLLMFAMHALYSQLLNAGIEIYEYRKSFMHSKVAVIDTHWATVGSSNIDPFSLMLAYEANVIIEDDDFAATLKSDIEKSISSAHHVTIEEWENSNRLKRFFSWIVYGVLRVMLNVISTSKTSHP